MNVTNPKTNLRFLNIALLVFAICTGYAQEDSKNNLRAPAYPLITIDPNMSAWSYSDNLYESTVSHWSDKKLPFLGAIKINNEIYRFMGTEDIELRSLIPNGEDKPWIAKYVTEKPADNWISVTYDDAQWQEGNGAFGTMESEPLSKTDWTAEKIWVRREITLHENVKGKDVYIEYSHDDDAEVYVNGIRVVYTGRATGKNKRIKLSPEALKTLKKGKNILAAYCHNTGANGFLDMGLLVEKNSKKYFAKEAKQLSVDVQPMQTHYLFACGDVQLKLTFTAPLFLDNLHLLSRPVNYLTYEITVKKTVDVALYFEASPSWALHLPSQESTVESYEKDGIVYLKTGSKAQNILGRKGDHVRNDWGYFYMASSNTNAQGLTGSASLLRQQFTSGKAKSSENENAVPQLALIKKHKGTGSIKDKIVIAYDDVFAIQYFGNNLRPYWNKSGDRNIEQEISTSLAEHQDILQRANGFDQKFMGDYAIYGKEYAELCALAYRQAIAAHKLVEAPNGDLLWLSKENDSNGSIGTVDVTYPSSPMFLYYNPELAKALINFIFYYSESGKWSKPFAAHDIGTYPLANGQTYGGDMPVEESGNMLILSYAIAKVEGQADYAKAHWNVLTTWVDYLVEKGLDPENQLCTDDFAGHFAHNANLSVKAILGIASYGYLARMMGREIVADKYINIAREMASKWKQMANDGDHYRLTFDKPNTWSQKYNLVWDKLLDMQIFDPNIIPTEIRYYLTKQNKYGLPLDSRRTYTKTDWIFWTATMANDLNSFQQFIKPVHSFMNETIHRVPMSDWTYTDKPERAGFKARSVVGGYFIKMLEGKLKQ